MFPEKFIPQIIKLERQYNHPGLLTELYELTQSELCTVLHDDEQLFVLQYMTDGDEKGVFIWLGIHNNPARAHADYSAIEHIASEYDVSFLRFQTKRKGFERVARRYGYQKHGEANGYTIWNKRLR